MGGGGESRAWGGDFDIFFMNISKSPPVIIGASEGGQMAFKPRSRMIKFPTLGTSLRIEKSTLGTDFTIKFPLLARHPPSGLKH